MAPRRHRNEDPARLSLEERLDREAASTDLVDVPAAVICARCGNAECVCETGDDSRSGIVAIVAWERQATPMLSRLWSTARQATRDAEGFFELLPDGPVGPALRFAATCELLAVGAMLLAFVPVAAVVAPSWLAELALDPASRSLALRLLFFGVPAFAALLVLAHAAHGLSIDVGATRSGARCARSRALRFGLYACGWDLVIGPLGAIVIALKEGAGAALGLGHLASGLPTRATKAFLRGCYRLDGASARAALGISYVGAALATALGVVVVLGAIVALVFG
jgi:hypothetical protein